jgi:hypothetical protein
MAKKIKKFSLPLAKVLTWNPAGKSLLYVPNPDRAYMIEIGHKLLADTRTDDECANFVWAWKFADWLIDWRARNVGKSVEEENRAYYAAVAEGTLPPMPPMPKSWQGGGAA